MMARLLPFAALLTLALAGCGSEVADGPRGEPAPTADLGKPLTKETLDSMPPQARQAAQASMDRGAAMKAQYDKQYGAK